MTFPEHQREATKTILSLNKFKEDEMPLDASIPLQLDKTQNPIHHVLSQNKFSFMLPNPLK